LVKYRYEERNPMKLTKEELKIIRGPMDEQALEIKQDLKDYYANPEEYTLYDFEEIFQDRDPFEFL
jgi:hypothetical protein